MNTRSDAPGANDDGSGTAALIEAARVLSQHRFAATLVFASLSGEEQGLYGGKVIADYARAHNWQVEADLNNDIVGNTEGMSGVRDNTHVRVFSEGTRAVETPEEANRRRYNGGEVDLPSRNLARFMDRLADRYLTNLDVVMVYRTDRYGRGGDHVRMLEAGYPAVRVTEAVENYTRQHQDLRTENGIHYGDMIERPRFSVSRAGHAFEHRHHGRARLSAAAAERRDDRGKCFARYDRELARRRWRGELSCVVALHHRSAMALEPLGGQRHAAQIG